MNGKENIKNDLLNADFTEMQGEAFSYIFAEMATKDDLRMLSTQLTAEMGKLRLDLCGEMSAFRGELRGDMKALRSELHGEMNAFCGELRGEMKAFHGELRGEMNAMGSRLETRISEESKKTQRFMMTLIVTLGVVLGAFNVVAALMP